jgi:pseudaminic acid cytidylyltransferase
LNIAIIPARGGSKRIPGKNIKNFFGKPVIAHSIQAALASGVFDRVVVSTDSDEIASVAQEYGAEVPFLRPESLSNDYAATAPVIVHAMEWLLSQGIDFKYACCLYAAAPFVQSQFLMQGLDIMGLHNCASCYSVASFPFPIMRGLKINSAECLEMFWPEYEMVRSQELPEAYHDAGQFYWVEREKFMLEPRLYAIDSRPVVIPRHFVQDIDTPEDWLRAEYMYKALVLAGEIAS